MSVGTIVLAAVIAASLTVFRNWRVIRDGCKAARIIAGDPRVPRWLKALLLFGLSPFPGPADDFVLPLAIVILIVCHRQVVLDAWDQARRDTA